MNNNKMPYLPFFIEFTENYELYSNGTYKSDCGKYTITKDEFTPNSCPFRVSNRTGIVWVNCKYKFDNKSSILFGLVWGQLSGEMIINEGYSTNATQTHKETDKRAYIAFKNICAIHPEYVFKDAMTMWFIVLSNNKTLCNRKRIEYMEAFIEQNKSKSTK